jgi:hypothetical protein
MTEHDLVISALIFGAYLIGLLFGHLDANP